MELTTTSFLGRGWAFPIQFDKASKQAKMLSNEEDIQNSLHVLLATRIGERFLQPKYGCNVDVLLFEPITESLRTYLKDLVFTAIYYYEPRIDPLDVQLEAAAEEGVINITVTYHIRQTNTRHNLVFPYYLDEGNLIVNNGAS